MSGMSLQDDHPIDDLPDYVAGAASDAASIEAHLDECEACQVEVEVLRALRESGPELSDIERQRVYQGFEARRAASRPSGNPRWLTTTWRAAAAIAVLLTSVGVWQVVQSGSAPGAVWDPQVALDAWSEDLAEFDIEPGAVQAAFGFAALDEVLWDDLEGVDLAEVRAPWEEN